GSVFALNPAWAPPSLSVSVMTSFPEPSLTLFHTASTAVNRVCSITSPFRPTLASAGLVPSGTNQYSPKSVFLLVPTGLGAGVLSPGSPGFLCTAAECDEPPAI